ncbi:hypothetical protein BN000_05282 [Neobacillus massiliamazoniensis]|uniref:Uncharacterized protein n=1 Tax=Neobacillus massiliamazoniensis TaxID=1499688 RepID=A0A0U1P4M1_9BACI|nr:hypothetical protein BN000_05282 [Neobacillus massiliamazoniensis]
MLDPYKNKRGSSGKAGQGRPRRRIAPRRLLDRPRKASAWSGNQQASLKEPIFKEILSNENPWFTEAKLGDRDFYDIKGLENLFNHFSD